MNEYQPGQQAAAITFSDKFISPDGEPCQIAVSEDLNQDITYVF